MFSDYFMVQCNHHRVLETSFIIIFGFTKACMSLNDWGAFMPPPLRLILWHLQCNLSIKSNTKLSYSIHLLSKEPPLFVFSPLLVFSLWDFESYFRPWRRRWGKCFRSWSWFWSRHTFLGLGLDLDVDLGEEGVVNILSTFCLDIFLWLSILLAFARIFNFLSNFQNFPFYILAQKFLLTKQSMFFTGFWRKISEN